MSSELSHNSNKPLILLGAGGHAKVVLSLIKAAGLNAFGVCAPELVEQGVNSWRGIRVLGTGEDLSDFSPDQVALVNAVGKLDIRLKLFNTFKEKGYYFPVLVHPHACVDESVKLGEGTQVMAGAVIQADTSIGMNVIINTHASVDHDCVIGAHVHIGPGAVLCGGVCVHKRAFVASGSTIIVGVNVGEDAVVGAGASVVRDIEAQQVILPASVRRKQIGESTYCGDQQ